MRCIKHDKNTGEWFESWEWDDWLQSIDKNPEYDEKGNYIPMEYRDENPVYDEYGYYIPLELREDTNDVK